jgi:hypothetical protein
MLSSTWATIFSVSSSRMPRSARTCILRMPTSEVGRVGADDGRERGGAVSKRKQPSTNFRFTSASASTLA